MSEIEVILDGKVIKCTELIVNGVVMHPINEPAEKKFTQDVYNNNQKISLDFVERNGETFFVHDGEEHKCEPASLKYKFDPEGIYD